MSTRSRVGIQRKDGSIKSVYVHYDGHPERLGQTLRKHWKDPTAVAALIDLGDISFLGKVIGRKHKFDGAAEKHPDWTLAYHRDRGDKKSRAIISRDWTQFNQDGLGSDAEWLYVFTPEGKWLHAPSANTREAHMPEPVTAKSRREDWVGRNA